MKSKVLLLSLLFLMPATVCANTTYRYGFECITIFNTRELDREIGEAQLFVDVIDWGTNADGDQLVLFTFGNEGPDLASICGIYFDDGTLLEMYPLVYDSTGTVSFTLGGASPPDLPDPDHVLVPDFEVSAGFVGDDWDDWSGDSDPVTIVQGVNPGESISILFALQDGLDYMSTITALNGGLDLRIGLFVLGIGPDWPGYELGEGSFVNTTSCTLVPAPGAILLGSIGVGFVGWLRRRRTL